MQNDCNYYYLIQSIYIYVLPGITVAGRDFDIVWFFFKYIIIFMIERLVGMSCCFVFLKIVEYKCI